MGSNLVVRVLKSVLRGDRRRAIFDLSATGALIGGSDLPEPGAVVTLTRGSLSAAATVAWRDGTRAGLQFHRPLPVEQLFTIVHSAQYRRGAGVPAALAA
jgi:hypothetical protein